MIEVRRKENTTTVAFTYNGTIKSAKKIADYLTERCYNATAGLDLRENVFLVDGETVEKNWHVVIGRDDVGGDLVQVISSEDFARIYELS